MTWNLTDWPIMTDWLTNWLINLSSQWLLFYRQGIFKLVCDTSQNPGKPETFNEEKTGQESTYVSASLKRNICSVDNAGWWWTSIPSRYPPPPPSHSIFCALRTIPFENHADENTMYLTDFFQIWHTYVTLLAHQLCATVWFKVTR